MKTEQHITVPGGGQIITRAWHPSEKTSPWWIVPAAIIGSDRCRKTIRLSIHGDGSIGPATEAGIFAEISRNEDGITFALTGAAWRFAISLAVASALDKHAGSKLI